MTHAQFQELLPLYVLGALDGTERRALEQYIHDHRFQCAAEIAEFQAVADQLAHLAPPATPPAQVLDRVLAAIAEPMIQTAPGVRKRATPPWFGWLGWGVAAAASVLVAMLLRDRIGRQDLNVAALRKEVAEQTTKVDLMLDPAVRVAALVDPAGKSKASAKAFWNAEKQSGLVVVSNVEPVLQGAPKTLELWLICEGQAPIPAGLFFTDKLGHGIGEIKLARQVACAPKFAVSVEPAAGVDAPTGPIVLLGQ